jgi:hypothetical protein
MGGLQTETLELFPSDRALDASADFSEDVPVKTTVRIAENVRCHGKTAEELGRLQPPVERGRRDEREDAV